MQTYTVMPWLCRMAEAVSSFFCQICFDDGDYFELCYRWLVT